MLEPDETYLDLTGRHATYFYANRPPPVESGSVYNLVGEKQQLRGIASLQKRPVPLVLISADNILHDGGPAGLRAHLLYRYLLTTRGYQVATIGKHVWLVDEKRVGKLAGLHPSSVTPVDDSAGNALHAALGIGDLGHIPASWGRSYSRLEKKLQSVATVSQMAGTSAVSVGPDGTYRIAGESPAVRFHISKLALNGRDAGILGFDFECDDATARPVLKIFWSGADERENELRAVRFAGDTGRMLVPLDALPSWLLAEGIKSLRFDVVGQNTCGSFSLKNIQLYQRATTTQIQD